MIIIDIETTGLNFWENGILSIGALCFDNPKKQFYEECRIDNEDIIAEDALKINGFSKEEIINKKNKRKKN